MVTSRLLLNLLKGMLPLVRIELLGHAEANDLMTANVPGSTLHDAHDPSFEQHLVLLLLRQRGMEVRFRQVEPVALLELRTDRLPQGSIHLDRFLGQIAVAQAVRGQEVERFLLLVEEAKEQPFAFMTPVAASARQLITCLKSRVEFTVVATSYRVR